MSAKRRIREAIETIVRELLTECGPESAATFATIFSHRYPGKDAVSTMTDEQLRDSINLLERTMASHAANQTGDDHG